MPTDTEGFLSTNNKSKMKTMSLVSVFFEVTILSLFVGAAFPDKRPLSYELRTFLLYKVWPVVMVTVWFPMVASIVMKLVIHVSKRNWEEVLDTTPMFLVGCFALYCLFSMQMTAHDCKEAIDLIKKHFFTVHRITIHDFLAVFTLWFAMMFAFLCYIGGCIYYGEVLVPMWLPFIDNDKELTKGAFYFIWSYQSVAAFYILCALGIWGPFIVVSTICIRRELDMLIKAVKRFRYIQLKSYINESYGKTRYPFTYLDPSHTPLPWPSMCSTEEETKQFIKNFVEHHTIIKRTVDCVSRTHSYIFLVQTIVLVVHSCLLTFHTYHTKHQEKVLIKSIPILFVSYYMMFVYCWSGQRLTDKCEELFRAAYQCPWYYCPRSFKSSLMIMMQVFSTPVKFTGGGIFVAELPTFLNCAQQSISYILLLKELTPQGE